MHVNATVNTVLMCAQVIKIILKNTLFYQWTGSKFFRLCNGSLDHSIVEDTKLTEGMLIFKTFLKCVTKKGIERKKTMIRMGIQTQITRPSP